MGLTSFIQAIESKSTLGECALAYAQAGFAIFPLIPRGKTPLLSGKRGGRGFKDATSDLSTVRQWWAQNPMANIGCVPGLSSLLVIDLDGPTGESTWSKLLPTVKRTLAVETGRSEGGRHLYFRHPGGQIGNLSLGRGIDVRADAGYVVLPPSVHPSRALYRWINPSIPVAHLPPELLTAISPRINEGERNNALATYLGGLRRNGSTESELLQAARAFNEERCSPPLPSREVESVARSISRYPPADFAHRELVEELNSRYAVIQVGNRVRVMDLAGPDPVFLPREDFRFQLSNKHVSDGTKMVSVGEIWLRSPFRKQYSRLVFEPGVSDVGDAWNLWRGWGVDPRPGDCSLFLHHIRENVCGNSEELSSWVLAWIADIFQRPKSKPGTALVLRGKQGTGKTIIGTILGRLLGSAYKLVASAHRVTGQFNAHMLECLLMHADEAFWAADQKSEGVLKNLVTSDFHYIERKGIDAQRAANYL